MTDRKSTPLITLNVNVLYNETRKSKITGCDIENQDPTICCLQDTSFTFIYKNILKANV